MRIVYRKHLRRKTVSQSHCACEAKMAIGPFEASKIGDAAHAELWARGTCLRHPSVLAMSKIDGHPKLPLQPQDEKDDFVDISA